MPKWGRINAEVQAKSMGFVTGMTLAEKPTFHNVSTMLTVKEGLYRIWCGVNTLGDSGVKTLGDTSAFVNPTVQLLLTRRGKITMDGVGIVFEFYIAPL